MSDSRDHRPAAAPLYKQKSWSPDMLRDEAWSRRKGNQRLRRRLRSKSVTDDDLDELKGCFDLGFGFDSPDLDPKLSNAFPALDLYWAVSKQFNGGLSRTSSDCESISSSASHSSSIVDPADDPETVKTRLKQWAQIVACSLRHSSPN